MRLPLIVRASPSFGESPTILLRRGKWRLTHNCVDTILKPCPSSDVRRMDDGLYVVEEDYSCSTFSIKVDKQGTEKEITAHMEYVQ